MFSENGKINVNVPATSPGDITPPAFSSAEIGSVANDSLVITMDELLDSSSVPDTTDFTTSGITGSPAITGVSISGAEITLTLASAAQSSDVITVSYVKGTNPIKDVTGNESNNFTDETVTNNTGFTPADLDNQVFWLPMDSANITSDANGISQADDTFGTNDFTQSDNSFKPNPATDEGLEWADFIAANTERLEAPGAFQTEFRGDFSIAFRVKPDDGQPAANQHIFSVAAPAVATDAIAIQLRTTGIIRVSYRANSLVALADTNSAIFTNGAQATYKTVVVTFSATQISIYIDGILATLDATNDGDMTGVVRANYASSTAPDLGGQNLDGIHQNNFDGLIGDVIMTSDIITAGEAANISTYMGK
jgi:hypothetical protein